jgi:MSHA biogenesis protein MshL
MIRALLLIILFLTACSTHQPVNGTAIDEMAVDLHEGLAGNRLLSDKSRHGRDISKALVPEYRHRRPHSHTSPRRFDIAVKDIDARAFFMGLVADTSSSIIVSPEIQGKITLNLKKVTVEQVLQAVEDVYNYAYKVTPNGYQIFPNTMQTQIYSVNYLELERQGHSNMTLSSGEVTQVAPQGGGQSASLIGSSSSYNGPTNIESTIGKVTTRSTFDFWKQLKENLENMIGKENGHSVTVNPLAGVVVVRALPKELKQIDAYLDLIQGHMDRQVILEAKILEVTLNNEYQMGIDWKIYGAELNALSNFPQARILQSEFPDAFRIKINWNKDFTTLIQALETQGNVQVLSSPRVATMNNQKSLIKVGFDEFFVTNISQNNNSIPVITSDPNVRVPPNIPNISLTPFFSGITLDVTPQIDKHGDVTLHIHPSVSLVTTQHKSINFGKVEKDLLGNEISNGVDLPLAHSTIRESDTVVHAKNGQVVIIGGLMENHTTEDIAELPFFGNIPFLGTLLRRTKQNSQKSELVILLKPTIVNKASENYQLHNSSQRLAAIKRGFHFGSRPDIFGTEGEEPIVRGPKAGVYK